MYLDMSEVRNLGLTLRALSQLSKTNYTHVWRASCGERQLRGAEADNVTAVLAAFRHAVSSLKLPVPA